VSCLGQNNHYQLSIFQRPFQPFVKRLASPKGAQQPPPQFSAYVYCGHTAGWIKMPLVTEVGLGDIVLDGDPALPPTGAQNIPTFRPCLLWSNDPSPSQLLLSSC